MSEQVHLGLTGSIGMGKSTVAKMFMDLGVPVFDADAKVHELQGPGGAIVPAIEAAFPGSTGPQGVIREELGKRVFGDREAMTRLEAIVHPAVARLREDFLEEHSDKKLLVFDVPLLFETGQEIGFDKLVVVSAGQELQRQRVLARPGMDEERFEAILQYQLPDKDKRARADFVIDTSLSLDQTREKVAELVGKLTD